MTNGVPPGNTISVGPPLGMGRYFIGLYNPNTTVAQTVFISATLGVNAAVNDIYNYIPPRRCRCWMTPSAPPPSSFRTRSRNWSRR